MDELEQDLEGAQAASVWAAFGDLMTGVLGAFVLILACALVAQMDLAERLETEAQRRQSLEQALAGPLAALLRTGSVSLSDGRIGISGQLLFAPGSDQLHPEGRQLLQSLAAPLAGFLAERDQVLMVSGFTDDRQVRGGNRQFADNWELSALRALTVTRALIADGLPPDAVYAAAFGAQQPVASNADAAGRALNRRVELAPSPRIRRAAAPSAPSP